MFRHSFTNARIPAVSGIPGAINRQKRVVDSHFSGLPLETRAVLVYNPKLDAIGARPIRKSGGKKEGAG